MSDPINIITNFIPRCLGNYSPLFIFLIASLKYYHLFLDFYNSLLNISLKLYPLLSLYHIVVRMVFFKSEFHITHLHLNS